LSIRVSQKSYGTMEVVIGIGLNGSLEVGNRGREVSQLDFCYAAAVERVNGIRARSNRLVVAGAGAGKVMIIEIEKTKLLVIASRWIIDNGPFQFVNAAMARKSLKRGTQQAGIRNDFSNDVDQRSNPSQKKNDEDPISIRTAADKMDDRDRLQDDAPPRSEKEKERSHAKRNITRGFALGSGGADNAVNLSWHSCHNR
jgi:hypothetical protein